VGVKVNGVWVNNIRYAGTVGECSKNMSLNINTKKTNFMIISRKPQEFQNSSLTFENQPIEQVNKLKYLGTLLCENWESNTEIKCRIENARNTFMKFKKVYTNTDFDLGLRIKFVKCYVWTVLLYGIEGWTLKVSTINKLEAFEMWGYRRVLRILWTAKEQR